MSAETQVYLLDPKNLSPETIAVTFAKTSRSPESFREIAAELNDEKSAQFHEKWVVGYGHSSVAEHAVLHIAVENCSRLAVEALESCRLASYTEKSTRYQKWTPQDFHSPAELEDHPLRTVFTHTVETLFRHYLEALPAVKGVIEQEHPREEGESDSAWERRIRSRYVDICRFYLPAAALANVGMTINARALEHSISKMLSHPLMEVQALGRELKRVGQENTPTLIKYANAIPYLETAQHALSQSAAAFLPGEAVRGDWCQLIDFDRELENRILAAALYRFGTVDYAHAMSAVGALNPADRQRLAHEILFGMEKFVIPLRELEYGNFTFDVMLDQGGYFELKRHRMMTQTPQQLTTHLGYAVPRRIVTAGLEDHYRTAMQLAADAYEQVAAWNPAVASYLVPNAYNRRVLLQVNLRSALHLLSLRSASNAHFSLRRLTQRMAEEMRAVLPLLGAYINTNEKETWQKVEQDHFAQV
ncbi:MAG TPA: FAD-dependent thymidylate synthase [Bellilinea sp.]|nr:FAD-dependent thymidylate synthase [Bellilinea sp.]